MRVLEAIEASIATHPRLTVHNRSVVLRHTLGREDRDTSRVTQEIEISVFANLRGATEESFGTFLNTLYLGVPPCSDSEVSVGWKNVLYGKQFYRDRIEDGVEVTTSFRISNTAAAFPLGYEQESDQLALHAIQSRTAWEITQAITVVVYPNKTAMRRVLQLPR